MLIIHGDKDYRVPIGEALRMWADLAGRPAPPPSSSTSRTRTTGCSPRATRVLYETVFAFLAQHVLGEAWQRPALL